MSNLITVQELIEALQKLPSDAIVAYGNEYDYSRSLRISEPYLEKGWADESSRKGYIYIKGEDDNDEQLPVEGLSLRDVVVL